MIKASRVQTESQHVSVCRQQTSPQQIWAWHENEEDTDDVEQEDSVPSHDDDVMQEPQQHHLQRAVSCVVSSGPGHTEADLAHVRQRDRVSTSLLTSAKAQKRTAPPPRVAIEELRESLLMNVSFPRPAPEHSHLLSSNLLSSSRDGRPSEEYRRASLRLSQSLRHRARPSLSAYAEGPEQPSLPLNSVLQPQSPSTPAPLSTLELSAISIFCTRVTKTCQHIVSSRHFPVVMVALVLLNTLNLASEHEGQSRGFAHASDVINTIFSFLFFLEMMMKMISLGLVFYFADESNVFDCVMTLMGVAEAFAPNANLAALRCFRLFRVMTMLRFLPTLRKQMTLMMKTVTSVLTFLLLLFLFCFMAAIIGMHLFGQT